MSSFDTLYSKLNPAQKSAVDTIEGPVMVIAGPGTGKTTILTLRIANILKQTDTPAHGILAITYTDAGVKAMRAKLQGVIGSRAHDVAIHTFHSFASAMIAEYPDRFLHIHESSIMTDIEQEGMIRQIIVEPGFSDIRPVAKPDAYLSAIICSIEESKRQELTPQKVRIYVNDEIERIQSDPASISTRGATKGQLKAEAREAIEKCQRTLLFADVYERYESLKRESKKLDFGDLIIELLVALHQDELFLRLIQERFLYILVDEHQDTNDAQNSIVALIAEFFDTPNIFMVGDEKQAIYRFQGASVDNFLRLRERWPSMKTISLDMNYRSHQGILDASFGMIENNYEDDEHADLRIELMSGRKDDANQGPLSAQPAAVEIVTAQNVAAMENHLMAGLKRISESDPTATVAVITRRNKDLDRVIRLCDEQGVRISSERSVDIFNHPIGSVFFDLMRYLVDPSAVGSLARTITAGMWRLSFEDGMELIRHLKSRRDSDLIDRMLPGLVHIRRQMLNDSPIGSLVHVAERSGYLDLVNRDPSYLTVWRGIITLAESIVRDTGIIDPARLMEALLAYRLSAESRMVKVTVGASDIPIQALTAHGSKGLEFDYVFVPYATDEAWIGKNRGASFVLPRKEASMSDTRDARRLFYVALTRARERVSVLTAGEESDGKVLSPLRFISELPDRSVGRIELPHEDDDVNQEPATERLASVDRPSWDDKVLDLTRRTLLEKGLSVTALNHFLTCPNAFIYQSILKLPQAPSVSAEKGNAMHEALSRVWSSEATMSLSTDERIRQIGDIITASLEEFFALSFLSSADKEAVKKDLLTDVPAVARSLDAHFRLKGDKAMVYTEHWVKALFRGSYGGMDIEMPIHGKLDAILELADHVLVFDYKTRQAMSVNAIKGETKNSDGGYFRQLVFYKLLMQDQPKWRSKQVVPALVFVSPDDKGRCPTVEIPIMDTDIERVEKEIQSLIDAVWGGSIMGMTCGDDRCEWCGMRRVVG